MHEDLLGYLLGALDSDEMQRVSQLLRDDPEAREQLAELERMVRPLEDGYVPVEPPPLGLVARTLANIPFETDSSEASGSGSSVAQQDSEDDSSVPLAPMISSIDSGRNSVASWFDWVGGAAAAAVLLCLMLPALAEERFESRKVACQDNLRQLGTALTISVSRSSQERLPAVSESGPEAFAGVYAIRLNELGLIYQPSMRWCPSLDVPSEQEATLTNLGEIVSSKELHEVSVDRLRQIQRYAGGHYAYNLGVVEQDRLASPRFEARSSFAVMADAPLSSFDGGEPLSKSVGHSGVGINVLYEDGRVRFIPIDALKAMPDHPLVNHRGNVEAGVNIDDASLAPSWRPPFIDVNQR